MILQQFRKWERFCFKAGYRFSSCIYSSYFDIFSKCCFIEHICDIIINSHYLDSHWHYLDSYWSYYLHCWIHIELVICSNIGNILIWFNCLAIFSLKFAQKHGTVILDLEVFQVYCIHVGGHLCYHDMPSLIIRIYFSWFKSEYMLVCRYFDP